MMKEKCTVDIHTHILPGMDDGASSLEESLRLVSELSRQGITVMAATPHFYADRENPSDFFDRRQNAISLLTEKLDKSITVLPGAEVCYYQGISRTERLSEFAIGQTNLLLLEMPFCDWTASVIKEVCSIQRDRKLQVIIAHIDRYMRKKNMDFIDDMLNLGILFQINANAFLDKKRRNEALKMVENGIVQFVASDCHNMTARPPTLREAYDVIEKKFGTGYMILFNSRAASYFQGGNAE